MAEEKKFDKIKYNNEYISNNYDRINLTTPKGKKEKIYNYASKKGESVNAFINRVIDEAMGKEQ